MLVKNAMKVFLTSIITVAAIACHAASIGRDSPSTIDKDAAQIITVDFNEVNRPYALVAGGSKGIGYAIAEALAIRQFNLILVARHIDALVEAKKKLEEKYGIHVEVLELDLAYPEAAPSIAKWCIERNIPLKMLCNVAGLGGSDDYLSLPLDTLRYMVNLNVESCMSLSLLLLPLLEKNAPSYILNVSSMAAFAPIPSKNMYSATKSAILFFSYSLNYQLKDKNISVSCLTPGPVFTKTEIKIETKKKLGWLGMAMAVSPAKVGELAVRGTLRRKQLIIPGFMSKVVATGLRILPKRFSSRLYGKLGQE